VQRRTAAHYVVVHLPLRFGPRFKSIIAYRVEAILLLLRLRTLGHVAMQEGQGRDRSTISTLWVNRNVVVKIYKILKRAFTFASAIVAGFWHIFGSGQRV
jgi:hypothetical protein